MWMGYYRICQVSIYSDTHLFHSPSVSHGPSPLCKGGTCTSSGKYGPSRGDSPPSPMYSHWHQIFPPYFGTKFGKYNFLPQTWRSIVSIDIVKACLYTNIYSVWFLLFWMKFVNREYVLWNTVQDVLMVCLGNTPQVKLIDSFVIW